MELSEFLQLQGYTGIALTKSPVGHFEVQSKVNGEDALLLIDTGASRTVFDASSAARLRLDFEEAGEAAAGLGVTQQQTRRGTLQSFAVGSLQIPEMQAWIVDLSHVNTVLQQRGATPCAGVLGADLLAGRSAVIDYKSSTLYLKQDPD